MLVKLKSFLLILPLISYSNKNPINLDHIGIYGTITMQDLNDDIPINFRNVTYNYISEVFINVFVNNKIEIDSFKINSNNLKGTTIYINGFDCPNQSKKIKIQVGYVNYSSYISTVEFSFYGPSYNTIIFNSYSIPVYKTMNPFKIDFYMKDDYYETYPVYESVKYINKTSEVINNTRYFNLSKIQWFINSPFPIDLTYCEFRIYYKDENSDFIYRNQGYMLTDIMLTINFNENYELYYSLVDEYKYYVNEHTGSINESYTSQCNEDVLPLFFPFSMGFDIPYKYEIVFYNVGYNHNDYIIQSYVTFKTNKNITNDFGSLLNFKYIVKDENLTGIEYE